MVGIDLDGVAALRDLELDVVEPIARRAAHGVDDELIAGAAGDLDAAGEGLEPERAARRHRQRAVDGFGLARATVAVAGPLVGESHDKAAGVADRVAFMSKSDQPQGSSARKD